MRGDVVVEGVEGSRVDPGSAAEVPWELGLRPVWKSSDVVRVTGLSYRQLDYALTRGYLSSGVAASGSGSDRLFSTEEVLSAAIYARALVGAKADIAAKVAAPEARAADPNVARWQGRLVPFELRITGLKDALLKALNARPEDQDPVGQVERFLQASDHVMRFG